MHEYFVMTYEMGLVNALATWKSDDKQFFNVEQDLIFEPLLLLVSKDYLRIMLMITPRGIKQLRIKFLGQPTKSTTIMRWVPFHNTLVCMHDCTVVFRV